MRLNKLFILILVITKFSLVYSQAVTLELLTKYNPTQLRGISIGDDQSVWVSGSNGYVGHSTDNGKTWEFQIIFGFEKAELRDIHAFDSLNVIVMSSVQPTAMLKTTDGGKSWKTCYIADDQEIFLDGFDFWDKQSGICFGDPINNRFLLIETNNGGETWERLPPTNLPEVTEGTVAFAASGNGIHCLEKGIVFFVTGGNQSSIFKSNDFGKSWKAEVTPMESGFASSGIFALDVLNEETICIIGGDYTQATNQSANFFFKNKKNCNWTPATTMPLGYKSCVKYLSEDKIICCGTSGVDIASTVKYRFRNISTETFHTIAYDPKSKKVYLAGSDGKVVRLIY